MIRSLSVLLPVYNAQATLVAHVTRMLDCLAEFTSRFDLMIIDDGSTDATPEVAHELSARFPQVKNVRTSQRLGIEDSLRHGLARTRSQLVIGLTGVSRIDMAEIAQVLKANGEFGKDTANELGPIAEGARLRLLRHDTGESFEPRGATAKSDRPANAAMRPNFLARVKDFSFGR